MASLAMVCSPIGCRDRPRRGCAPTGLPPAVMFFYMERCSRIRGRRYHPRSRRAQTLDAERSARLGSGVEMPHGRAGDMSLPTCQNPRGINHKNNQRERNDEGFSEQARGACCSASSAWGGPQACRRPPRRAIRRATSRRSFRSRRAMPTTSPRASCSSRSASSSASRSSSTTAAAPAAPSASARRRAPRRTATPSCSIRPRSAPPM